MFGATEPRLAALPPAWAERANGLRATLEPAEMRREVESLPGPRNRFFSPEAMADADRRILAAFDDGGWSASIRPFSRPELEIRGANVVAVKGGAITGDAVVVVAHHDTVPNSVGADDNTASVVALLSLARLLGPTTFESTVVLAAVDMEETGFFGTRALVDSLVAERGVLGAVVLETMSFSSREPGVQALPPFVGALYVGQVRRIRRRGSIGDFTNVMYRRDSLGLAVRFAETLDHLAGRGAAVLTRDPLDLAVSPVIARVAPFVHDFARSDHVPFWQARLPAIMINDTANFRNPHYHTATDTPDTLDYGRLADITAAVGVVVENAARPVVS
ncbi:MAG: M28 family peptidase [Actinomycetota bacterium]